MANTLEEAAQEVADELRSNPNGAYGLAVRFASRGGVSADKIMARAVELRDQGNVGGGGAFEPVDVDWPSAETMAAQVLQGAEADGGLGPNALVLVPHVARLIVEERNRMLTMLGVLE